MSHITNMLFYGGTFFSAIVLCYKYDHYRNATQQEYEKQVEKQKKLNVNRYTNKELTNIVHNLPPNQWKEEQIQKLDRCYNDRIRQYYDDMKKRKEFDEEYYRLHPEIGPLVKLGDFPPTPCTEKGYDEEYKRFESES